MYYSDELIEEVRSRNPIQDVIGSYVHLTKKGANYFGLCPFHSEKTGSFSVSPSRQIYHCFGCNAGGNVLTFIMNYENVTFTEAMEILANRAGIELPKQEFTPKMKAEQDLKTTLLEIHKEAAVYYHKILKSPAGKTGYQYFKNRGLTDRTMVSFGLGYTGPHSNGLYQFLKGKGYSDSVLKESGLVTITEKGGRDKFWNRVMFPIMDTGNRVIGFGGRVLGQGEPKYLNSPETKLFDKSRNLYGLNVAKKTRSGPFILCEGYMDVIALHQAGFTNAVAALGTAMTSRHAAILKRYTDEVVLSFDSPEIDEAGKKAALRAIPILRSEGLRVKVLTMAPCKDPDEFIVKNGADAYRERVEKAENAFFFEVRMEREKFDFQDPDEKALFFNRVAKMLTTFTDSIERNSYIEAVSKKYGMDFGILKKKVEDLGNRMAAAEQEVTEPKRTVHREKTGETGIKEAERLILTTLAERPELIAEVRATLEPGDFRSETAKKVAAMIFEAEAAGQKPLSPAGITDRFLNDDQYNEVAALFSSKFADAVPEEEAAKALREAMKKVKREAIEDEIQKTSDPVRLMELYKKRQQL